MQALLDYPHHLYGYLWLKRSIASMRVHRHEELECNLVTSGEGTYLIQGRRVNLVPGSVLWLFPEQNHLLLDGSSDFQMWVLVVHPTYVRQLCEHAGPTVLTKRNPAGHFLRFLPKASLQPLLSFCHELTGLEQEPARYKAGLGYLLLSIWSAYEKGSAIPIKSTIHPAIEEVAGRIHSGEGRDDLETLAKHVRMTPATISRLFKQQTGLSVTAFRNRCRMERFLTLYGDGTRYTLLDAALEAGFGSYPQFYRVFTQLAGKTPAMFQKEGTL